MDHASTQPREITSASSSTPSTHSRPLAELTALVTGASRGLGAALARELARQGARVVLCARERAPLEAVAREITEAGGVAHALPADIGDKDSIHAIAGAAAALVGPIDLLIHNASTLGKTPLPILLDTECEDLERVLAVNVVGPFRLSKVIAGSMALRRRGVIVHISSDAAVNAYPGWGAYGLSKAALDHLSRTWAVELEGTGVAVYSVDPGEMNTRMHAEALPDADPATLADPAEVAARIVSLVRRAGAGEVPSGARLEASSLPVSDGAPLGSSRALPQTPVVQ
jgi:NAD(P)-dependent dehydrogenase (short-subunit alcohol dehydrogenase family)